MLDIVLSSLIGILITHRAVIRYLGAADTFVTHLHGDEVCTAILSHSQLITYRQAGVLSKHVHSESITSPPQVLARFVLLDLDNRTNLLVFYRLSFVLQSR